MIKSDTYKLIIGVFTTEWKRLLNDPIFFSMTLLRPYLWTLLLSEGIRHAMNVGDSLPFISLLSYCIIFTGITSAFSISWERHQGFLKLWFVYGINNYKYITGKLLYSCSLTLVIIIASTPIVAILNIPLNISLVIKSIPDILLAILLISNIGIFISSFLTRLDLFGLVINFVLFPILFTSGTIYNISSNKCTSLIAMFNPYRWAMEPIKCNLMCNYECNETFLISRAIILFLCIIFFIGSVYFFEAD